MRFLQWATLIAAIALSVAGCRSNQGASASCVLPDGRALDVTGRGDGVYGVVDERVGDEPLAHFEHTVRSSEGVDPDSGKRWVRIRLADDEARALSEFTATPSRRSIAVVVAGEVASQHKIRQPVTSPELQVSCYNPHACERWRALVKATPATDGQALP